jgi:hypothetical protein
MKTRRVFKPALVGEGSPSIPKFPSSLKLGGGVKYDPIMSLLLLSKAVGADGVYTPA